MENPIKNFEDRSRTTIQRLKDQLSQIRAGRATPSLVENIIVECWGTKTPLKGVGSIMVESALTLRIDPWDKTITSVIEKAIQASNIGVSTTADKNSIRINFPQLTEDRRKEIIKIIAGLKEDTRVLLRRHRDDIVSELKKSFEDKKISEDELFRLKEKIQESTDKSNKEIDDLVKSKEEEVLRV